ncbi:MAG: endonuclease/exonuclease/phosphatase family protein [Anaerolineae bacterium]|nr:endonuclease/exonuclease/phosphatase family protein [Anaerolineae bacterium]
MAMISLLIHLLKKIIQLINYSIAALLWLFGMGLMVWYPLRWWPGDRFTPIQLLNYFTPWLLVALLPALIFAALSKRRWLMLMLIMPTFIIMYNYAPLFLPRATSPALAHSGRIKVMSYNIWGYNRNTDDIADIIHREQPDILFLQEIYGSKAIVLKQKLQDLYPGQDRYYSTMDDESGQGIISRYPLTPLGISYTQGRAQKAIIHTPDGDIHVWNVHLKQPRDWVTQHRQVINLVQDVAHVDQPLIVGGDFNTTEQSEVYKMIDQYLDNTHWEAGWGFGFSFPAEKPIIKGVKVPVTTPMLRIDHIFHNNLLFTHSAKTLSDSGGSDHYPVVSELSVIQ